MKTRQWLSRGEKEVLPTKSITRVPSTLRLFSRLHLAHPSTVWASSMFCIRGVDM